VDLNSIKKNWKTSALGACMILGAIGTAGVALLDSDPATVVDWKVTSAALVAGWGLLLAKDANVTGGTVPATNEAATRTTAPGA
jgi:hypothetical protein